MNVCCQNMTVRPMLDADADAVLDIFREGIETGHATFEEQAPDWDEWCAGHLEACRLIACEGDQILGWAALSPASGRCVYGGVAEVSVYVSTPAWGRSIGRRLLDALVDASEAAGLWTLQAGIFPENQVSITLHRRAGFREVGVRRGLGRMAYGPMAGQWRDVVLLERRSRVVGTGAS